MQKIFVIDASGYLYSSYFAIRNMTNSRGESTNALYGFIRSLHKLIKDFQPTHLVAVFDGPRNAKKRLEIYPDYKAHRLATPQDLPCQISWAQEYCTMLGIPYLNIPEVEADDSIGAVAKWAEKQGAEVYICSTDKDLCQLINDRILMLNTRKENQVIGIKEVEETYGVPPDLIIDLLSLTGDSSDNVPGVPGIGPKTASALLKQFGSLDQLLANQEQIAGDKKRVAICENADQALLSRKLVRLDLGVNIPNAEDFYQMKPLDIDRLKIFYSGMNFNSLIRELELTAQKNPAKMSETASNIENYLLIDDEQSLSNLIDFLKTQKEICFDTETTNLHPLKAELIGIGFGVVPEKAWYVPLNGKLGSERVLKAIAPLFENPEIGFYGHHVKYDYHVLANYSINVANICFDTLLASYLLNSHNRQHSLDALSLQYFGKAKIPITDLIGKGKKVITLREVAIEKVREYCCEDVDYTCRLKSILEKDIKERRLESLITDLELPLIKVLAKMERHGIFLDLSKLENISHSIIEQIAVIEKKIYALAGKEFNLNSPKQLSQVLQDIFLIPLPKKSSSNFSTHADVLESLKEEYPIAGLVLDYRNLEKLRSTYIQSLPDEVNQKTARIHCTLNQSVTATGRLSCQDPNLQNIPVRTEAGRKIRESFRPQLPNWSYLAADYSQIELRLLAHFSGDPNMIDAFQHSEDIHASTAAAIFNIPLNAVSKEQRHQAKAVNFGIIYGQQAFGLAKELKIDVKSAAAFIETYFKRFGRIKDYIEQCKEQARQTGQARTHLGRQRAIPEINSKNGQFRMLAERLAVNTPLQGTAADLIKLAMLKIDQQLSELKVEGYMILQIHDELLFELPDHEIETFIPLVKNTMQNVFKLKIPLIVDIAIGKNWKEC